MVPAHLPPTLPEQKRIALEEFYAGRISAGEFSRRVTHGDSSEPEAVQQVQPLDGVLTPERPSG